MFRLIQLHVDDGTTHVGVDSDGFTAEYAALADYRSAPGRFFGVGRFSSAGKLVEVIVDMVCRQVDDCPRAAIALDSQTFRPLCTDCSFGVEVLRLDELATRLGVTVRVARIYAGSGRHAAEEAGGLSNRIAREFASHVVDPVWRTEVCSQLAGAPEGINGLLIGVGALSHRDVLDLFPALRSLAAQLPVCIHAELVRATARPLSPAGVAALRLGL